MDVSRGLHDKPGAAEQGIAGDQRDAAEQREGRQPIEGAAGVMPSLHLESLDEGAKHDSLGKGCRRRSGIEGDIPPAAAGVGPEAEFEGDAAKDQPRSEEHTSELQSLMRISYAVFCLK